MQTSFLNRVKQTLIEHLEDENFGVKELAFQMGLSSSQLLRKVKHLTKKPVNQFIKEIRLNEALVLLEERNYTVAEIAYKVGFGSPSYFSKCFHDKYGYPPGEFRINNEEPFEADKIDFNPVKPVHTNLKRNLVLGVSLLAILIIFYVLTDNSNIQKANIQPLSIAVMPFENLSKDLSNQYFADGMMDVIMNQLSNIEQINVISRTTMMQYGQMAKTTPEIAKELNISYLLEASVQKFQDKVRIVIQLIDAKKDTQIWSDDFEREYKEIFLLQSDIAKQVARELKKNLSPMELGQIEKIPTKNSEAFNLYLKGRFFWHSRTVEGLESSIPYFEKAIALDTTYAMAYAGLADTYFIMTWRKLLPENKGYVKGRELAETALSFDNRLSEAYATLGGITFWHEWNWKIAEIELKRSISINTSYATAHQYYAELLNILQRNSEAREQINLAIKLNPNSPVMYYVSSKFYYNNNEFKKAIHERLKHLEFRGQKSSLFIFKSYVHLGMDKKAIEHLKLIVPNNTNNTHSLIDKIYQEFGINGVINWVINSPLSLNIWEVFGLSAIVGESQKLIEHIEKNPRKLLEIRINPDFKLLKSNPKFRAQLNSLKLKDNNLKIKNKAFQDIKSSILK